MPTTQILRLARMAVLVGAALVVFAGVVSIATAPPRAHGQIAGDCDGDGVVTVDDLIRGIAITRGAAPVSTCAASTSALQHEAAPEPATIEALMATADNVLSAAGLSSQAVGDVLINIGSATGSPGQQVTFAVTLSTAGQLVAGMQNDTAFDPATPVVAQLNGVPDCSVNPAINKGLSGFAFQPVGCTPGLNCQALRALIIGVNLDAIPDGAVLYTCHVNIASDAVLGAYSLACSNAIAADPTGYRLGTTCNDGVITVVAPPTPTATATPIPTGTPVLIPGSSPHSCTAEWLSASAPARGRTGVPVDRVVCTDNDPLCDFGANGDHACTFRVAMCLNVTGASACAPSDVSQVWLNEPGFKPRNAADSSNRTALEEALTALGGRVQGVCIGGGSSVRFCTANAACDSTPDRGDGTCLRLVAFEPPLETMDSCTAFAEITVPLRQTQGGVARGQKTLRLRTVPSDHRLTELSALTLVCKPKR